jgi:hypothetical protein
MYRALGRKLERMEPASKTSRTLLEILRERDTQASGSGRPYLAPVADEDTMLFWLSKAASAARDEARRKQVHVAAGADVDQSTIWRFERAGAWPRNPDRVVAAYAEDLDITAFDLWEEALRLWREHREGVSESPARDAAQAAERLAQTAERKRDSSAPGQAARKRRGA